jgi:hypothetical protein
MQEKSFFSTKNQHVAWKKVRKGRGLTEKGWVMDWNCYENSGGSGCFFETPVKELISFNKTSVFC